MGLRLSPLGFYGAEEVELDGVRGVFIPEYPNFSRNRDGELISNIVFSKARVGKKFTHTAKISIPQEYRDKFLSDKLRFRPIGWYYPKTTVKLSKEDLNSVLKK